MTFLTRLSWRLNCSNNKVKIKPNEPFFQWLADHQPMSATEKEPPNLGSAIYGHGFDLCPDLRTIRTDDVTGCSWKRRWWSDKRRRHKRTEIEDQRRTKRKKHQLKPKIEGARKKGRLEFCDNHSFKATKTRTLDLDSSLKKVVIFRSHSCNTVFDTSWSHFFTLIQLQQQKISPVQKYFSLKLRNFFQDNSSSFSLFLQSFWSHQASEIGKD